MKKTLSICLVVGLILVLQGVAFGLNTPAVREGHGVVTGMFVQDNGIRVGAEYGLTGELAIGAEVGDNSYVKVDAKYEIDSNLAILGGLIGSGNSNPFLGINGAIPIGRSMLGIGEIDLSMPGNQTLINYELGLKLDLAKQLDIRFGLEGSTGSTSTTLVEMGIGYKF